MRRTASTASKLFTLLSVSIGIALAILGGYLAWAWNHGLQPGSDIYVVKPGTGLIALAAEIERRSVLPETRSFLLLGYLTLKRHDFKAGEYRFRNGMSARELLAQVAAGRVVEYPFRIAEGSTFRQVLEGLAKAEHLAQTLQGMPHAQIMARLGAPDTHPEGRFYPDTYFYAAGNTDLMVLRRAYDKMQARLQREWENRNPGIPLKTPDEALTLASIIEKETGRADERRLIAGVFINRLKKNMRLGTDPTVIYGLGAKFDGNLRKRDLLTDTPYNTYTRRGLPPTPIAMPAGASLHAAVNPESTRALYFVSRGDGSHAFSETYEEHNRAIVKYQLGGRPLPAPIPK